MQRPEVVVQRDQIGRAMGCTVDGVQMPAVRDVQVTYYHNDIIEVRINMYARSFREEVQEVTDDPRTEPE